MSAVLTISRDYLELSKARIVLMVLITTAAGYLIGAPRVDADATPAFDTMPMIDEM